MKWDERAYVVVTMIRSGEVSAEQAFRHPLDAAAHLLTAEAQRGLRGRAVRVFEETVQEQSVADLVRSAAARGHRAPQVSAQEWRQVQATWLRYQLGAGPELAWAAAGRRWAAAFALPVDASVQRAVGIEDHDGWTAFHEETGRLVPLLGPVGWQASSASWAGMSQEQRHRYYADGWPVLDEARHSAPELEQTAKAFLRSALDSDARAGALEGILTVDPDGEVADWARAAYGGRPQDAARLLADLTADRDLLTAQDLAWAQKWERMPSLHDAYAGLNGDPLGPLEGGYGTWAYDAAWSSSRAAQKRAQHAALAYLARHRADIRASRDGESPVVREARRLVRSAFRTERHARLHVAHRVRTFAGELDVEDTALFEQQLQLFGEEWGALHAADAALQALAGPGPEDDALRRERMEMAAPPSAGEPAALWRVGARGGEQVVTADPQRALFAWLAGDRPDRPLALEEEGKPFHWVPCSPRSLVELVRAQCPHVSAHQGLDLRLATWLLHGEPRHAGASWERMGRRWALWLGQVPPRAPVLAWLIQYTGAWDRPLERLQIAAAKAREGHVHERNVAYDALYERELAASLAAASDDVAAQEEHYPPWRKTELGAGLGLPPHPEVIASAERDGTRYVHAVLGRARRRLVVALPAGGRPAFLADWNRLNTEYLFAALTAARAGGGLLAPETRQARERAAVARAEERTQWLERQVMRLPLQLSLARLEAGLQTGAVDEDRYRGQALALWDRLFLFVEGTAPQGEAPRRWYSIAEEGVAEDLAALAADPVEAVVWWARLDSPGRPQALSTGVEGRPGARDLDVAGLLRQALQAGAQDSSRCRQALAEWIARHRDERAVPGVAADPAALRWAGWAWALRVGEPIPPGVLDQLAADNGASQAVQKAARTMSAALGAARHRLRPEGGIPPQDLRSHWRVAAAAAAHLPEAAAAARDLLDQLIAADSEAPAPPQPGAADAHLRRTAARIWILTREHHPELAEACRRVADPASAPARRLRPLFAALPRQLTAHPQTADQILQAAEATAQGRVLQSLYSQYPDAVRTRFQDALDRAAQALSAQSAAAGMSTNARALPAAPTTPASANTPAHPHDMAQQASAQAPRWSPGPASA